MSVDGIRPRLPTISRLNWSHTNKGATRYCTACAVVDRLGVANVEKDDWPSRLVWSNLYKVAPAAGGNPSNALCNVQLAGCIDLFRVELATYAPQRLLLLTGLSWAEPFLHQLTPALSRTVDCKHVEATGYLRHSGGETQVVVAAHPQGQVRESWVTEVEHTFQHAC